MCCDLWLETFFIARLFTKTLLHSSDSTKIPSLDKVKMKAEVEPILKYIGIQDTLTNSSAFENE